MNSEWLKFLERPVGRSTTAEERFAVHTRAPMQHLPPSVALYEALVLLGRGQLRLDEIEGVVALNGGLDRALARKPPLSPRT